MLLNGEFKIKKLTKKGKLDEIGQYQEKIAHLQLDKENAAQARKEREKKSYKVIFKKEPMVKWLILIMIICCIYRLVNTNR